MHIRTEAGMRKEERVEKHIKRRLAGAMHLVAHSVGIERGVRTFNRRVVN
jgi:hypothetical protein